MLLVAYSADVEQKICSGNPDEKYVKMIEQKERKNEGMQKTVVNDHKFIILIKLQCTIPYKYFGKFITSNIEYIIKVDSLSACNASVSVTLKAIFF